MNKITYKMINCFMKDPASLRAYKDYRKRATKNMTEKPENPVSEMVWEEVVRPQLLDSGMPETTAVKLDTEVEFKSVDNILNIYISR